MFHDGLSQLDVVAALLVAVVETEGTERRFTLLTPVLLVVVMLTTSTILPVGGDNALLVSH